MSWTQRRAWPDEMQTALSPGRGPGPAGSPRPGWGCAYPVRVPQVVQLCLRLLRLRLVLPKPLQHLSVQKWRNGS